MREDARNLMKTLDQDDFRYREFENTFYVNSTWKLFSAILCDARVLGHSICAERPQTADGEPVQNLPVEPQPLLERYSMPTAATAQQREVDLREFFTRVSEGE